MNEQIVYYKSKLMFEIDPSDLKKELESNESLVVIDARQAAAYQLEHIPLAINLYHGLMDEESTQALDKNNNYVCYCDGIGCNASTKGALKMAQLGFKVRELIGGLDWWKRDGYPTHNKTSKPSSIVECGC